MSDTRQPCGRPSRQATAYVTTAMYQTFAMASRYVIFISVCILLTEAAPTYKSVYDRVAHRWNFDQASDLSLVADIVTRHQATTHGSGVKLQNIGQHSRNNIITLKGPGSSMSLGQYDDCCGNPSKCSSGLTISFWLRFREVSNETQYFIGNKPFSSSRQGFVIATDGQGKMSVNFQTRRLALNMVYPAQPKQWTHHVITWDGNRAVAVYIDGQPLARANRTTTRARRHSASRREVSPSSIMLAVGANVLPIDADVDDLCIWNAVLSRDEAAIAYASIVESLSIYRDCRANSSSVCINWKMPEDHFGAIARLSVMAMVAAGSKLAAAHHLPANTTSFCVPDLVPVTSYSLHVEVLLKSPGIYRSEPITCTTTDGVPNPPSDLTAVSDRLNSAMIKWKSPRVPGGVILHFIFCVVDLFDGRVVINTTQNYAGAGSEYSFRMPGVAGRTYRMSVRSVGKLGFSAMRTIDVTMMVPAPTEAVTGARVTAISWNSISLSWQRLPGYEIPSSIKYKVRVLERRTQRTVVAIANSTTVTVRKLSGNTAYYVNIAPFSSLGGGPEMTSPLLALTPDHNECADPWDNLCDANADCLDVPNSYLCRCHVGFYGNGYRCRELSPDALDGDFCLSSMSRDLHWPKTFNGEVAIVACPMGTVGYATRICSSSRPKQVATFNEADLSGCVTDEVAKVERMMNDPRVSQSALVNALHNATLPGKRLFGGDVVTSIDFFGVVLGSMKGSPPPPPNKTGHGTLDARAEAFIGIANNLLDKRTLVAWDDIPKGNRTLTAERLLASMDDLASYIAQGLTKAESFSTRLSNVDFTVSKSAGAMPMHFATEDRRRRAAANQSVNSVLLPVHEIMSRTGRDNIAASFIVYKSIDKVLSPGNSSVGDRASLINSAVLSVSIVGEEDVTFTTEPVVLTLRHPNAISSFGNTSCVFWDSEAAETSHERWSSQGCYVNETSSSSTTCHCYHLTNFAILMTVADVAMTPDVIRHGFYLRIISYCCLFVSLAALLLALFSFTFFRFLQSARVVYHKNLVVALILANALFVAGIEQTENRVACTVVAVFLHYFFLVAFVWMAMEGLMLYLMLKKIFADRKFLKTRFCQCLCWVLPAVYVVILANVKHDGYGTPNYCWLSTTDGFIWAFVGPIVFVLAMNATIMAQALCVMATRKGSKEMDASREAWYWMKGCSVLTCLLGVTWIIGLFYVNGNTVVFAYLFNICNALQGLFILVFHCLIDSRVRAEYVRILKCQPRHEYNEKAGYTSSMRYRHFGSKSSASLDRSTGTYTGKRGRLPTTSEREHDPNESGDFPADDSQLMPFNACESISIEPTTSSCSEAHSESQLLLHAHHPMATRLPSDAQPTNEAIEVIPATEVTQPTVEQDRPPSGQHAPLRQRFSLESLCKETQLSDRNSIHFDRLKEGSIESLVQQVTLPEQEDANSDFLSRLDELLEGKPKRLLKATRSRPYDEATVSPLSVIQEPSSESLNTIKSDTSKPCSPVIGSPRRESTTLTIELRRGSSEPGNQPVMVVNFESLKDEDGDDSEAIQSMETVSDRPPSLWMEEKSPEDKFLSQS